MGAAVLAGIIFVIYSVFSSGGINNPPPGKVWSPEHGHWHDAPATSTPRSTPLSNPLIPQPSTPSTESTSEPPGPAPPGKVWSTEHSHWHDAPVTAPSITPQSSTKLTSEPPGPAPPGKVWSPDHGHWHDAPVTTTPVVPKTLSETPPEFEK